MKLKEAKQIIEESRKPDGYRVHFERREGGMLVSDFFQDRDEEPVASEDDAWDLAREFAGARKNKGTIVNVYVITAADFAPVPAYRSRMLNRHPPKEDR